MFRQILREAFQTKGQNFGPFPNRGWEFGLSLLFLSIQINKKKYEYFSPKNYFSKAFAHFLCALL